MAIISMVREGLPGVTRRKAVIRSAKVWEQQVPTLCMGPGLEQSKSRKKTRGLKQNNVQEKGDNGWWKDGLFAQNDQESGKQYIFFGHKDQRF